MCQNPWHDPLTTREQIFQFLVTYKRTHDGNSPTTREIAEACCLGISTVNYHLTRLEIDDRIRVLNQRPRTYEIVGGTWAWPGDSPSGQDSRDGTDDPDDQSVRHRAP